MATTKWSIDPTHSEVQFKVKHMMIATVTGQFSNFNASVETNGNDFSTAKVQFTADINSISTGNEQRDAHLKTGDFFDSGNHPQVLFESSELEKTGEDSYIMHGALTMRGVTHPVSLNVEFGGTTVDPWGNTRVGFDVSGKINRRDYGVSFSMVSETGGILLGEEVRLLASAQFVRQAELQEA
jgi:polyisoprenoid-binding protein YceI